MTQKFPLQQTIDQKNIRETPTLEATIEYLGEKQEALTFHQNLNCDWAHKAICVTFLLWNNSLHDWSKN